MDELDIGWPVVGRGERLGYWDLADGPDQQDWQERALCAQTDPEAFFPEKGGSTREAKRICSGCEVRAECLEYALAFDQTWCGLTRSAPRFRYRSPGDVTVCALPTGMD
jgi:WhiB family redox-sensing transcriptional regulator